MRLSKVEVARRTEAVLTYFRTNPTASVAKLNAALKDGSLTGKPEKMLNIATGYKLRKLAVATPVLPGTDLKAMLGGLVDALKQGGYDTAPGELKQGSESVATCSGDGCQGCAGCHHSVGCPETSVDKLPATLEEHAATIEETPSKLKTGGFFAQEE